MSEGTSRTSATSPSNDRLWRRTLAAGADAAAAAEAPAGGAEAPPAARSRPLSEPQRGHRPALP